MSALQHSIVSAQFGADEADTLYRNYLSMIAPQKKLHIYKKSTQKLVLLAEAFALCCLQLFSAENEQGNKWDGFKLPREKLGKIYENLLKWYTTLLENINSWASWDPVHTLTQWNEMRLSIQNTQTTCPDPIRTLSQQKRMFPDDVSGGKVFMRPTMDETIATVTEVVSSREHLDSLFKLRGAHAIAVIDLLDNLMTIIEDQSRLHTRLFHTLRKLCGELGKLPTKYNLSKRDALVQEKLVVISDHPMASGGFADVWLGSYKDQQVAIKAFRVYGRANLEAIVKGRTTFCREAVLWRRLSHPNITPFIGIDEEKFNFSVVCQWMPNGNITTYLKNSPGANRLELLVDIAQGLEYLHSRGVLHGDIKGANILIDEKLHACLADFGLSAVTYDPNTVNAISTSSSVNGSIRWMAPELLNPEEAGLEHARPSPEGDTYSFAMVMWEIFTGRIPFYNLTRDATVVFRVILGIRPDRPAAASALGLSDEIWALMETCWCPQWQTRPRIRSVLEVLRSNLARYGLFGTHPQAWPLPDDMPVAPNQSGIPVADDSSSLPDFTQLPTGKSEYVYPSSFAPIAPAPPNNALAGDEDNPDFARALDLMNDMSFGSETFAPTSTGAWGCIADDEAWV